MKKLAICILAMILSFTFNPSTASAAPDPIKIESPKEAAQAKQLISRLEEIKLMDVSKMSHDEKKAIRKEVKAIKAKLHDIGGGVYISAGALILILVLLIIFL
jgi:Skp family chaperone for outer membrane proteins